MLLGGLVVTCLSSPRRPFLAFPRSHIRLSLTATPPSITDASRLHAPPLTPPLTASHRFSSPFFASPASISPTPQVTGRAIQGWLARTSTPRSDLFITSKVLKSVDAEGGVEAACRRSLRAIGCEYFDLYLIHAPFHTDGSPFTSVASLSEVWAQLEALVDEGLVRQIGVSNWRVGDLEAVYVRSV